MKGDPEEEQIIEVATRLFAELGLDGTSVDLIADAAGLDAATVNERTGGRLELYYTVMRRAHETEMGAVETALASFTPTPQGVIDYTDAYLDFHLANPWITWLWIHRWLGDAADTADLEVRYRRPLTDRVAGVMREVVPPDLDIDYAIWTVAWIIASFVSHGLPGHGIGTRRGLDPFRPGKNSHIDPETLAEFRSYLHAVIRRLILPTG